MFKNLFDLSVKRTGKEALGFYIVYFLIGFLLAGLLCAAAAMLYCFYNTTACEANATAVGVKIGRFGGHAIGIVYNFSIGLWLLTSKKLWKSIKAFLMFIITVPLFIIGGNLLSLIPLAVLTTFDNQNAPTCELDKK